ncbi:hypothetical protein D1872_51020 [compost metagenome]
MEEHIFLCYPVGYEERLTAIIATSELEATDKSMRNPSLKEAVEAFGAKLIVKDLSKVFSKQGYNIFVQREGSYH